MLADATLFVPSSRSRHRHSLYQLGRQGAHKARRLAKLAAGLIAIGIPDARPAPGQLHLHLRRRKCYVGETALLVPTTVVGAVARCATKGQQALIAATDEHHRPLAAVRSVDGQQGTAAVSVGLASMSPRCRSASHVARSGASELTSSSRKASTRSRCSRRLAWLPSSPPYGCYRRGDTCYGFLLEYDRGTEPASQYAAKLAAYYRYRHSGQAARNYSDFRPYCSFRPGPCASQTWLRSNREVNYGPSPNHLTLYAHTQGSGTRRYRSIS